MEFWGVEVKPGQTVKCNPGDDKYLHLSQASLGETKKDKANVSIPLHVSVDGKKLVIGTLSPDKCAQITYDLVFEKEFELSHSWKDGSVFFVGYKTIVADDEPGDYSDSGSESDEEELPVSPKVNGKVIQKVEPSVPAKPIAPKANASASKAKAKAEESPKPEEEDGDEDGSDNEEDEDDSDDDSDEDMIGGENDSDDEEDEEESSDEEKKVTPKKAESGKKRPAGSESKASVSDKKAKLVTPAAKTGGQDGKKGGHTATPYPNKQAAKTPGNEDKSKQQTPKSAGAFSCKSCSKTFNSDNALQSHSKAKHAAK